MEASLALAAAEVSAPPDLWRDLGRRLVAAVVVMRMMLVEVQLSALDL
jgi:hypothetical protein